MKPFCNFSSPSSLVFISGDLKENMGKHFGIHWCRLAADDIVLLGEPTFCLTMQAGGGRCSLEAPFYFLALLVSILKHSEIPHLSLKSKVLVFDAEKGQCAFI